MPITHSATSNEPLGFPIACNFLKALRKTVLVYERNQIPKKRTRASTLSTLHTLLSKNLHPIDLRNEILDIYLTLERSPLRGTLVRSGFHKADDSKLGMGLYAVLQQYSIEYLEGEMLQFSKENWSQLSQPQWSSPNTQIIEQQSTIATLQRQIEELTLENERRHQEHQQTLQLLQIFGQKIDEFSSLLENSDVVSTSTQEYEVPHNPFLQEEPEKRHEVTSIQLHAL